MLFAAATPVQAHFLWLTAEKNGDKPNVQAFLSETPSPDLPEFLRTIAKSKITAGDKVLSWKKGDDIYLVDVPSPAPKVIDGFCDLGVMKRGDTTFRLLYTGRVQFAPSSPKDVERNDHLRIRLVERAGARPNVRVTFQGKPAAAVVVKVYNEDGQPTEQKADAEGWIDIPGVAEGKTGLMAKWVVKEPGTLNGKDYSEVRYYATFTVAAGEPKEREKTVGAASASASRGEPNAPFAVLPEAINSFGGAVSDGWLYVYSGHTGDMHRYSVATTTPHFRRLNLAADRTIWEELPCGPALQGVVLVAHGGMLYRIGGASAKNEPGAPSDLASVADFARFDPQTKRWTDLPKLPTPRSTHDAVVVGDKIYVVGGWSMNGGSASNSDFSEDALVFDLSRKDARWEKLPNPPFLRRALTVAEHDGKVYVIGGLTEEGRVVKDVDVYDPATRTWVKGPELPGSRLEGFAASAFGVGGRLYVSGRDGILRRLSTDGRGWETAGKLAIPRLTHRLLPGISQDLLAVGGNFATAPIRIIESLPLTDVAGPKVLTWSVPVETPVRQGQAITLVRSKLLAVGGNRTSAPHAFQAENLVREGVELSLGRLDAHPAVPLPERRQSAALVTVAAHKNEAFLIGGIGPDEAVSRTLGDVFKLDLASRRWTKLAVTIPDARGMFGTAVYKDSVYLFGGSLWDPRPGHETEKMPVEVLRWDTTSKRSTFEPIHEKAPRARRSFAGAVLGSKYFMVGGMGDSMKLVDTVDVFDFATKSWSTIASPPKPRLFAKLVALDGKLYLAGGFHRSDNEHFQPAPSIEVFDPGTSTWATLLDTAPLPEAGLAMFPMQGRLLLYAPDKTTGRTARFAIVNP
jgi:N-acetylneuraminic acid mutarotase